MPIYEFTCPSCNTTFEELVRSAGAAGEVTCPRCGHRHVTRHMSTFATRVAPTKRASPPPGPCGQCCGSGGSCPMGE